MTVPLGGNAGLNDATGVICTTQRSQTVADKTVSIPKKADVIRMVLGDQRAGVLQPPENHLR